MHDPPHTERDDMSTMATVLKKVILVTLVGEYRNTDQYIDDIKH